MRFRRIAQWIAFCALIVLMSTSRVRAQEAAGPGPATPPASTEQAPGAAGNAQPASNTPTPPVLHSEARVVRVDVIVTDKKGKYVRDLTAKDFQVFDNDKEQQIINFSFGTSAGVGGPPDRHYMVLFFDDSTMDMGDQGRARQAALKFIDANAGPDRVMAVVDFTGVLHIRQNFTADAARLKLAAQNSRPSAVTSNPSDSDPSAPGLSDAQTDFSVYTMLLGLRSLAKDLRDVPGRKSVVLFTSGFLSTPEVEAELTATISACNQANVAVYPLDVRGLIAPMPGHSQLLNPGDKANRVWAADPTLSPALGITEERPKLALAAYRVPSAAASEPQKGGGGGGRGGGGGGGGPAPGGGGGRPVGAPIGTGPTSGPGALPYSPGNIGGMPSQMIVPQLPDTGVGNQSVLWELAEGTGGFTILNTNDLLGGLAKISDEQNEYYLLGYTPTDAEDGSCHSLRVKVEHGLKVRARTGYCTAKSSDMLAGKPVEKELEQRAAAAATGPLGGSLEAPFFYTSPNEARVNVAMDVPSSSIVFAKDKGAYHAEINVLGIAYRKDGSVGARFSDEVKLDLEKDAWKKFLESPMQYQNQFTIAPGDYKLTVILSAGGQNFGKYETPLEIDPYNGQTFSLSALALSDHLQAAAGLGASMEAALLADHTPLVAGGVEVVPSGSNRFKKRETVALYAQIYDPKLATSDKSDVKLIFRVVDTKTGKAVIEPVNVDPAQFIQKGNPVVALGFKLPLDSLAPGTYRLDMQAFDPSGARSKLRTVTFEEE